MKTLASPIVFESFLETLEDRIAPATLIVGGTEADHKYTNDTIFTKMSTAAGSGETNLQRIGNFFDAATDMYFIALKKGDKVLFDEGEMDIKWVDLTAGVANLYFHDVDNNGIVEMDEFTGMSIGGAAKFTVNGSIGGDIVGNLNTTGSFIVGGDAHQLELEDSASIAGATITGSVGGSIYTGGKIDKLVVGGTVTLIQTGTAASSGGYKITLSGLEPDMANAGTGFFQEFNPTKNAGAGISNVTVGSAEAIQAGNGGDGKAGGSITTIKVTAGLSGINILAGNGGGGEGVTGGAGGKVSGVTYFSSIDSVGFDTGTIAITGGEGGPSRLIDGTTKIGTGGAGGSVEKISIDAAGTNLPAEFLGTHQIEIWGGTGGEGKSGGVGGVVKTVSAFTADSSILVHGGNGGNTSPDSSSQAGAGGAGANVSDVHAAALSFANTLTTVTVSGGFGGEAWNTGVSTGGKGGDVTGAQLAANSVVVVGGDGRNGKTGGNGGNVSDISDLSYAVIKSVELKGGDGGESVVGAGGHGGSVSDASFQTSYITNYTENVGTTYTGAKAKGGDVAILQTPVNSNIFINGGVSGAKTNFPGNVTVETYVPGNVVISGEIAGNVELAADIWGRVIIDATETGSGYLTHIGGNLSINGAAAGVFLRATDGTLTMVDANGLGDFVDGTVSFSEQVVGHEPTYWEGSGFDAAVEGGKGGDGWTAGGNGGSLSNVAFKDSPIDYVEPDMDSPLKMFSALAGEGGDSYLKGGTGGSIDKLSYAGRAFNGFAPISILAGDGGSASNEDSLKADGGAGGKITSLNLELLDDTATASAVEVHGGDGGDGWNGGKGGAGGGISKSAIQVVSSEVEVHGGNGGASESAGGAGGALSELSLNSYVGGKYDVRAGEVSEGLGDNAAAIIGAAIKSVQIGVGGNTQYKFVAGNGANGGAGGAVDGISHPMQTLYGPQEYLMPGDFDLDVTAGDGSVGTKGVGGAGGAVKNVSVLPTNESVHPDNEIFLRAGKGAHGAKPGMGGNVENVTILDKAIVNIYNPETGKFTKQTLSLPPDAALNPVTIVTGDGGASDTDEKGANGSDAKNVKWAINGMPIYLGLGAGGIGDPSGSKGKAINVNGNPSTYTSGDDGGGVIV